MCCRQLQKFFLLLLVTLLIIPLDFAVTQAQKPKLKTYATPEEAAQDPDFALQGEYQKQAQGLQAIALGDGEFRVVIYQGGLPGAGWNGKTKRNLDLDADSLKDLTEGYKKVDRKSSTLGMKPPQKAVVLFDGTDESLQQHWKPGAKKTDDGLLMQGCTSTDTFADFSIHLEFRLPYMPVARGQARGNSGLYYQGRYETQMLDSFGLAGKHNECGGIYSIKNPDLNMCFPPLSWQTYDADFKAARYDDNGKKIENARITVRLNGVIVHNDVELPKSTTAAPVKEGPEQGPIYLQNHGNPVRYRNIWVVPRDYTKLSARPIVPGFERFYANTNADKAAGGRLLLGELNCLSCHQASDELTKRIERKQAPRLTDVGSRIRPEYLRDYLRDPHAVKPGTTMPDLLSGLNEQRRWEVTEPIVHFLASSGKIKYQRLDRKAVNRGRTLFHRVGCTVCHAPQEGDTTVPTATSVPLVGIERKYSLAALIAFLKNPHAVRASGRMPNLNLQQKEPEDIAHYLLRGRDTQVGRPRFQFQAYHGSWGQLPPFAELKPVAAGTATYLDIGVAGRNDEMAIRFTGHLKITRAGEYKFHLGSDDGSRLFINEQMVVDHDGIHGHEEKSGKMKLNAGMHKLRIDYFERNGVESLDLQIEGPQLNRQEITPFVYLSPDWQAEEKKNQQATPDQFDFDASQVDQGRELFVSVGCASCHELKIDNKALATTTKAKPLSQLDAEAGCLAETVPAKLPDYNLSDSQRDALTAALKAPAPAGPLSEQQVIHTTMTTFNCYACHTRDSIGGPERARNELFQAVIPEMGDEGRLPPPLDGVADKLKPEWLKHVMLQGAKDRPYMRVRMPRFGGSTVKIVDALVARDQKTEATIAEPSEEIHRFKANGRKLVGGGALSCIKCHTFGNIPATGIQAISLLSMHQRIREDWFYRYMLDPVKYRPGTRMPNVFPNGVSAAKEIYQADPAQQIAAMWSYLADGNKAAVPYGLLPDPIELVPQNKPVIYRNFLAGVSPRGIGVGYPEKVNIAFDAEKLALRLIWHGPFIDAGKHWRGRGAGTQAPLGDHVIRLEQSTPLSSLETTETAWPNDVSKANGYKFLGYQLDQKARPTFLYALNDLYVQDSYQPIPQQKRDSNLKRVVTLNSQTNGIPVGVYFRVARAPKIETVAQNLYRIWYQDDGSYQIRLHHTADQILMRDSAGQKELLLKLPAGKKQTQIVQEIIW